MVQEFHVLRCFSCQTFQVQQVKKSKKWACKVCGEKQSLMKEFGRGAAADCRRHVQKLNALRGRLQEVSSERAGSQWDPEDECENEDVGEGVDGDQKDESQQEVAPVSRWSKYTDPSERPDEHEDEEDDDENVYTERPRFRSQGSRKRKEISTLKSSAGPDEGCEDEEPWTGSGSKRVNQNHRSFSSSWNKGCASCGRTDDLDPCSSTDLPSSRHVWSIPASSSRSTEENSSHEPAAVDVTRRDHSPPASSRQRFGETKIENDSKWNKFLTQRDEEEWDHDHDLSHHNDTTEVTGVDCEERRYPPDGKSHSSKPSALEIPVCELPPLAQMLPFNSMFLTDEDFDDTF